MVPRDHSVLFQLAITNESSWPVAPVTSPFKSEHCRLFAHLQARIFGGRVHAEDGSRMTLKMVLLLCLSL